MKTCPFCAEEIQDKTIKCEFCGENLDKNLEISKNNFFYKIIFILIFLMLFYYIFFIDYNNDIDIIQNKKYTYGILKLIDDYEKTGKPMDYEELSKLIGLDEPSILSDAQDKNLTNIKSINKKIESYLGESYPSLDAQYSGDIMAMTKDLKENNPVAYNNFIGGVVRLKQKLDKGNIDQNDPIVQETLSNIFSSDKDKNIIDGAISNYNKSKPLSTDISEEIKSALNDLGNVENIDQSKNRLALLETISTSIVKNSAYTKNASDSVAEMVNSLSRKDLETISNIGINEKWKLFDNYPVLKELLQYSLTLRGRVVKEENFTKIPKFIGIPEQSINTQYPGCNKLDIIIELKDLKQIWSACNIGTNISGFGKESYGSYFSWGNNKQSINKVDYSDLSLDNENINAWGDITNTNIARQGPCEGGYHIPSKIEWENSILIITGNKDLSNNLENLIKFQETLKLPFAGRLGEDIFIGKDGEYWSSSPDSYNDGNGKYSYVLGLTREEDMLHSNILNGLVRRENVSIRCIRN